MTTEETNSRKASTNGSPRQSSNSKQNDSVVVDASLSTELSVNEKTPVNNVPDLDSKIGGEKVQPPSAQNGRLAGDYPEGFRLLFIVVALIISMFLLSLDLVSFLLSQGHHESEA